MIPNGIVAYHTYLRLSAKAHRAARAPAWMIWGVTPCTFEAMPAGSVGLVIATTNGVTLS